MARFATLHQRTASTTLSVGTITADATRPKRMKLYDVDIGCEGTPADNVYLWQVQRCTTAGTSTAVTPFPLDPADAATEQDAGANHTIDPTLTANAMMLTIPLNQRATFRWTVDETCAIVTPATASNGLAVRTPTASGLLAVTATLHWAEQ